MYLLGSLDDAVREVLGGIVVRGLPRPVFCDVLWRETPCPVSRASLDVVQEERHDKRERQDRDEEERQ